MTAPIDRRDLLAGGLSAALLAACGRPGRPGDTGSPRETGTGSPPPALRDTGGTLVLVELFGGLDGLSAVVPFEDDVYARSRPTTRLMPEELLRLNELRGLHPALAGFHRRYEAGELAVVEGTGYPDPVYSHFRAYEIWHTARRRGRAAGDGWIGRLREAAWPDDDRAELLVHVGGPPPYSLSCTRHPALSFGDPADFRWHAGERAMGAIESAGESGGAGVLGDLRSALATSNATSSRVLAAMRDHRSSASYPAGAFAGSLRVVAAMMNAGFGTRCYSVSLGNFDSHGGTMKNTYWQLLKQLDRSLDAFLRDIAGTAAGERTCVLVFTEFGRRVLENRSGGTDHGAAAPLFLFGPRVRGGMHGAHPSLEDLDGDGNLRYTTDFRRVYASVARDLFGADPGTVLGADHAPLSLLG